ncbi:MAG: hypothetical protein HY649_03810 [Acidobacteria bacterium]|nr:hypothetical protein [Acidobacteriota bacterium]
MGEDFHATPVPIRLSCRYSNGAVVSYGARALAYDDSSLQVLSSENFEQGIRLNILAPFLQGIVSCRVVAASRSREQPAYFELNLRILKKPPPAAPQKKLPVEAVSRLLPEEAALAARELAGRLERGDTLRWAHIIEEIPASQRPVYLTVTAAAVALLLQDKGTLDLRHLMEQAGAGA